MTPGASDKQPETYVGLEPGWSAMRNVKKLRIALYSHDTVGIGHMRRNGLIAGAFAGSALKPTILMICGAREAGYFNPPPGVDYLTLPALAKRSDGVYHSRRLEVDLSELIRLRAETLKSALREFCPDVLIVDKVPRGALRELDPTLQALQGRTHCVLGLRDVLDDPDIVADEWAHDQSEAAIHEYYEVVWVYGSRDVYDVALRYGWSTEVADMIRYTGYLRRFSSDAVSSSSAQLSPALRLPRGRIMVCVVGGGQDGEHVAEAFAGAEFPHSTTGIIITGPFMPSDAGRRLREIASGRRNLRVIEFIPDMRALLSRADRVVAMGGYNTVCELLSLRKPALIVPRTVPRREQLIRAENMRGLGLLDCLRPDDLTAQALTDWLARDLPPAGDALDRVDFNGLDRLPMLLSDVLATPHRQPPAAIRYLSRAIEHVA